MKFKEGDIFLINLSLDIRPSCYGTILTLVDYPYSQSFQLNQFLFQYSSCNIILRDVPFEFKRNYLLNKYMNIVQFNNTLKVLNIDNKFIKILNRNLRKSHLPEWW